MDSCIQLKEVTHDFGAVRVLERASIQIDRGEVRAMVGEHGAGKSTLAKVMGGLLVPRSGQVIVGQQRSPIQVELVHQMTELMGNLTVSENMFITDRQRFPSFFHRRKRLHHATNEFFQRLGVSLRGEQLVSDLKRADWVLIDILRKVHKHPDLLILDEAIEQLSNENAGIVIEILKQEKRRGMSIVYITHRIDDIFTFADTVSIIKNGMVCFTEATENIDKINLIKIAYTQLAESSNLDQYNQEFFHLLKYNEAILRKLPVSLIVVNRDEAIKIINEAAEDLLNVKQSLKDARLEEIFAKSPAIAEIVTQSFQTEELQQFFYLPFTRPDSKEMLLNISKVPIFDEHFLIGNILLLSDITEQENLRQEFELREKLAATGLLAAGVAHEINNPLGMIFNDLHFLKVVGQNPRTQPRISNLEKHFGYIQDVVSNLLTFSDQRTYTGESGEVVSTIHELLHLLQFYVKAKNVKIQFETTEKSLWIRIAATKLKQILLNLIKNSLEAFHDGGTIRISVDVTTQDTIRTVRIQVADNGPGFPIEQVSDAFIPFRSTKTPGRENFGLGLSVSYNIVKKHNGSIMIESDKERGCTITIFFPALNEDL